MHRIPLFLTSCFFTLFIGCGQKKAVEKTPAPSPNTAFEEETTEEDEGYDEERNGIEDGNTFSYYNQVEYVLAEWNKAIDTHRPEMLNDIYAEQVFHYTKFLTKDECVQSKTKWLNEHTGYSQKMEHAEVYFMESDTTMSEFIAEFDKICTENNSSKTVHAYLYFKQEKGSWKIIKETDDPTVISQAKKAPVSTIKNGESKFYNGHWTDTRNIPDFAHQMVPYRFSLSLTISTKITGSYFVYSGTMRETTDYLVTDGKMEDGILTLSVIFNENEQYSVEDYPKDTKKEQWHFKIINGNELICLDKDNGYLYAKSLLLEE